MRAMPRSGLMLVLLGSSLDDDAAERVCPPTTLMMTQKPVRVARFRRTGMEVRWRLGERVRWDVFFISSGKENHLPKAESRLDHLPHAGSRAQRGEVGRRGSAGERDEEDYQGRVSEGQAVAEGPEDAEGDAGR